MMNTTHFGCVHGCNYSSRSIKGDTTGHVNVSIVNTVCCGLLFFKHVSGGRVQEAAEICKAKPLTSCIFTVLNLKFR